jgi:superfamily II DNA/RNA helicase
MYNQSKHRRGAPARRPSYHTSQNRAPRRGSHKQDINPARFIKPAQPASEAEAFVPQNQFADFDIHPLLKKNIQDKGFVLPSPIQDRAIPLGLAGKDIVGIANTGTGKTAAFAIPLLNKLIQDPHARALITAPTRELAQQIETECRAFAAGSRLKGALVIGGTSMSAQIRDLRSNPSIVIGTPGRLKDHVERGTLDLSRFTVVVLDEVDRMVDMGFITDIRFLLGKLNSRHQSYFFSATLDSKIQGLVESFLQAGPAMISVKTGETSDNVHQDVVRYGSPSDKIDKLHNVLIHEQSKKALVFDDTQRSVERLSKELQARGFKADAIHGGKSQGQRQRALARFRQNEINILVATDVAARGIDVVDITHVINYSTPNTYDDYIHRIGRAGRAGRAGQALTFVGNY